MLPAGVLLAAVPGVGAAADERALEGFNRVWARTDTPEVRGGRTISGGRGRWCRLESIYEPMAGWPGGAAPGALLGQGADGGQRPRPPTAGSVVRHQWPARLGDGPGRQQIGVNPARYADRAPAEIPFGDLDDPTGPTFKSFRGRLNDPPLAVGQPVAQQIDRAGQGQPGECGRRHLPARSCRRRSTASPAPSGTSSTSAGPSMTLTAGDLERRALRPALLRDGPADLGALLDHRQGGREADARADPALRAPHPDL